MAENNRNLETLFREKLDEYPSSLKIDKQWLKLESALDVKAFLSFNWNRFNIYYLASLLSTFCMSGAALYFGLQQPKYLLVDNKSLKSDTVYINKIIHDTVLVSIPIKYAKTKLFLSLTF